jgi:hypothetical protein
MNHTLFVKPEVFCLQEVSMVNTRPSFAQVFVFFNHETIPLLKVVWVKHSSNHFELTRTCESHTVMISHGQLQISFKEY